MEQQPQDHGPEQAESRIKPADAIDRIASDGIAAAQEADSEISTDAAKAIAHGLVRLLGRPNTALEHFSDTGDGDYLKLREEYLELYADPTIPAHAKEWIDWLGTYLIQRDNARLAEGEEAGNGTR